MNSIFMKAATSLNNDFVMKWKENGKRVVGYTCSYVPDEIFHAAGILPYRIRGFGAADTTIGDTYFGPFICSLPKCMLQLAGRGQFRFSGRRHHHAGLRFDAAARRVLAQGGERYTRASCRSSSSISACRISTRTTPSSGSPRKRGVSSTRWRSIST